MLNNKKLALVTMATTMMSTVVNATETQEQVVARNLGDWVSLVAEFLTIICLVIFAIYLGRFISVKSEKTEENESKVKPGVRNGMMTALIGMAICQAAIIVAQLCF